MSTTVNVKPRRLASSPQLWRLNQAGRLAILDEPAEPIDMPTAYALVAEIAAGQVDTAELEDRIAQ